MSCLKQLPKREATRSRPAAEHLQSSGKAKSQLRMLFLVSESESSRNGDIPLKEKSVLQMSRDFAEFKWFIHSFEIYNINI